MHAYREHTEICATASMTGSTLVAHSRDIETGNHVGLYAWFHAIQRRTTHVPVLLPSHSEGVAAKGADTPSRRINVR